MFFNDYQIYNSNSLKKCLVKKTKKNKVTLLKSPHVNKKSQEHFENINFKQHFSIEMQKKSKQIVFFKKLGNNIFSNISVQLKQTLVHKNRLLLNIFNSNHFKIKLCVNNKFFKKNFVMLKKRNTFKKILIKKIKQLLIMLELFGECFKTNI
jgi:ribosomal protein S10